MFTKIKFVTIIVHGDCLITCAKDSTLKTTYTKQQSRILISFTHLPFCSQPLWCIQRLCLNVVSTDSFVSHRPSPGPFQQRNSISIVIQSVFKDCNCRIPPKLQLKLLWLGPCMGQTSICIHLWQGQEERYYQLGHHFVLCMSAILMRSCLLLLWSSTQCFALLCPKWGSGYLNVMRLPPTIQKVWWISTSFTVHTSPPFDHG